jgi:hypothetical protein
MRLGGPRHSHQMLLLGERRAHEAGRGHQCRH